jgi:hypothetical protein
MTIKILCLGNNTEDTDIRARAFAKEKNLPCHGLLSELEKPIETLLCSQFGVYHSSIYDIEFGRLVLLCNEFDQVVILAQPKEQWSHPDAFYLTIKLTQSLGNKVLFQDPSYTQSIVYFEELVSKNKSFCIFPFIELLVNFDSTTVCCRSNTPITKLSELKDFRTDKNYTIIRNKMLTGELIPEHCNSCYQIESQGIVSARQQETVEWANRLNLNSINDLAKITQPAYYEIRPSNKCNLLCRICNPESSHLIEKEYKKIRIISETPVIKKYKTGFDIINFDNLKKLYVAGGEPTILSEFYQFLDWCIDNKQTNIEFLVNTNGTTIKPRLKTQLKHFSNFQFIFSLDGHSDLNHYVRWPSNWQNIISNWHYLRTNKHKIVVNTTVSIYNITSLDKLFAFIDQEFPGTLIHCNLLTNPKLLSPYLYPNQELALQSLYRIRLFDCYKNDSLFASSIDGYIRHFENNHTVNHSLLSEFFKFNDKLDQSRDIKLKDYLPELDKYRYIVV